MAVWSESVTVRVEALLNSVWTDITIYVMTRDGGPVTWADGRQTELGVDEPGRGEMTLLNSDHRFTVGNTTSPYYPYWGPGTRIRLTESVGYKTFTTVDGYVEAPDDTRTSHESGDTVRVSLIDLIGRTQTMPSFVSTLGAHIVYNGGSELIGYWPCNDPSGSSAVASNTATLKPLRIVQYGAADASLAQFFQVAGPDGEDASFLTLTPSSVGGATILQSANSTFADFATYGEIAVVFWTRTEDPLANSFVNIKNAAATTGILLTSAITKWQLDFAAPLGSSTTSINQVPTPGRWQMVSCRVSKDTGLLTLYVDSLSSETTMPVTTGATLDNAVLQAVASTTAFAHVQIYAGNPGPTGGTWTQEKHLTQYQMGIEGLERQSTGERIATLADYAGIDASMRDIDRGTVVMQRATLAGQNPIDAMTQAVTTEQGRLTVDEGRLKFYDRRRIFNI